MVSSCSSEKLEVMAALPTVQSLGPSEAPKAPGSPLINIECTNKSQQKLN